MPNSMSKTPHWISPLLAAVAVRIGLIATACLMAGITLKQYALFHDGWEYLRLSQSYAFLKLHSIDPETLRLYPGYPALIALVSLGQMPEIAGLAIAILAGAACGPLTSHLGRDERLVWWMIAFTPSWLVFTATVMSEGLFVLLAMTSLLMATNRRWVLAGLTAGLATTVRLPGALLFIPLVIEVVVRRDGKGAMKILGLGLPLPIANLLLSRIIWGDAMSSVASYIRKDFAWPLQSFVGVSFTDDPLKFLLTATMPVLALAGGIGLFVQWRRGARHLRPLLVWHITSGLFHLLLPSTWVYLCLDRFYLTIWPTTLIGLAPLIPKRSRLWVPLCLLVSGLSFAVGIVWLIHLAGVYPFEERALPTILQVMGLAE